MVFGVCRTREDKLMFSRRRGTVIPEGWKITGTISADGLVEINGQIEGEVRCRFLFVSSEAVINGGIEAECVAVDGRVKGGIRGNEVVLKSRARVLGDIQHRSLCVEPGAHFEGRSIHPSESNGLRGSDRLKRPRVIELKTTRGSDDTSVA
jgi:cytoskeletal protein CcmA (bactofilin family)